MPMAIHAALTAASCSAQVRTWPVSVTMPSFVSAITSLPSGDQRRTVQRLLHVQGDVDRIGDVGDINVVADIADTDQAGNGPFGGGALRADVPGFDHRVELKFLFDRRT